MHPFRLFLLSGLAALCSAHSCRVDKPDPAPTDTQTGANTFSCVVDGRQWIGAERDLGGGVSFPTVNASLRNGYLLIRSQRALGSGGGQLKLTIKQPSGTGTYPVTSDYATDVLYIDDNATGTSYRVVAPQTGTITVTRLDTVARVVSGTFTGSVSTTGGSATYTHAITDGRFDARLN